MVENISRFSVRRAISAVMAAALLIVAVPATVSAAGVDDYTYRGTVNHLDPWGFYTGYCTSFVAFRLSQEGVRLHGASLRGPNGQTAFFGNGGSWDAAARSIGYTVDTHPSVGAVAVWHGGEDHAWWGGHVAYVMAVQPSGQALFEEYNWSHSVAYDQRVGQAPRYIHFAAGVSQAPAQSAPKPAPPAGHPYHVTDMVRQRSGPGTSYTTRAVLQDGQQVLIACQARSGSVINGTSIWDRLTDGTYITDYYTTTPAFNTFSPGLPRC